MNDKRMNQQELKDAMADYLGGELSPAQAIRFEQSVQAYPELEQEVRELGGALLAMKSLDAEYQTSEEPVVSSQSSLAQQSWGKGHAMRLAATIILAFFIGYIVKGLEPGAQQSTSSTSEQVEEDAIPKTDADKAEESFSTRYAMEYLSDGKRSGLSRSLIAFSRASKRK